MAGTWIFIWIWSLKLYCITQFLGLWVIYFYTYSLVMNSVIIFLKIFHFFILPLEKMGLSRPDNLFSNPIIWLIQTLFAPFSMTKIPIRPNFFWTSDLAGIGGTVWFGNLNDIEGHWSMPICCDPHLDTSNTVLKYFIVMA